MGIGGALEVAELGLGRVPDLDAVGVVADQVFEVDCQGAAIALQAVAGSVNALGDVEDDGGEAILVKVDFLVVGDVADRAGRPPRSVSGFGLGAVLRGWMTGRTYLTSAKFSGRSHTSAPPKRRVLRNP
jgi:hypothetical protein